MFKKQADAMKKGLRVKMQAMAETRRCPKCKRKMALQRIRVDPFTSITVCRWKDCDYERAVTS